MNVPTLLWPAPVIFPARDIQILAFNMQRSWTICLTGQLKFDIAEAGIFFVVLIHHEMLENGQCKVTLHFTTVMICCIILLSYRLFHYTFSDSSLWLSLFSPAGLYRYVAAGWITSTLFFQKSLEPTVEWGVPRIRIIIFHPSLSLELSLYCYCQ